MVDPRIPDPRLDPSHPDAPHSPYTDPVDDPRLAQQTVVHSGSGRGGLIAAGVIAALLVIALIAFTSGPTTDTGTTATIPEQSEEMTPAPAPDAAPVEPAAPAVPLDSAPPVNE